LCQFAISGVGSWINVTGAEPVCARQSGFFECPVVAAVSDVQREHVDWSIRDESQTRAKPGPRGLAAKTIGLDRQSWVLWSGRLVCRQWRLVAMARCRSVRRVCWRSAARGVEVLG